jgi:hypothetical protein
VLGEAVARARQDSEEELQRRARPVDAWGGRAGGGRRRPARRRSGGRGAAPAAEGSRAGEQRAEGAQRKKMRGGKSKGSCVKLKRSRDFFVK